MKKEFSVEKSKFILTKDELSYQEVLDDMKIAEQVVIITYNISEKQNYLIDCLKHISETTDIKIITNIPNRWDIYYKNYYRELAQKKISVYLSKISPENIGGIVSVYFNFSNHGKIIMTNNVVYIGSSNYSDESKKNIEFGFIVRDSNFIKHLLTEIVPELENISVPYYSYNYYPLFLEISMALTALLNLDEELYNQVYLLNDHHGVDSFYYNDIYDSLSYETISKIQSLLNSIVKITGDIYEAYVTMTNDNEDEVDKINNFYEAIMDLSNKYEDLTNSDIIYELATYDLQEDIISILEDYSGVATEDLLEKYIEISSNKANEKLNILCEEGKINLDEMLDVLNTVKEFTKKVIEDFQSYNLMKINPSIDNT